MSAACPGNNATVFTRVQVAPKYKMHPNFHLDFLVSGHNKNMVILYPCMRRTPWFWFSILRQKGASCTWVVTVRGGPVQF